MCFFVPIASNTRDFPGEGMVVLKWMVSDRHEEKMFIDFVSITALPDFPRRDFLD